MIHEIEKEKQLGINQSEENCDIKEGWHMSTWPLLLE